MVLPLCALCDMEVSLCGVLDPIHGVGLCGILRLAALRGLPSGELGFGRRSGPILSCPQRRDVASSVVRVRPPGLHQGGLSWGW